MVKYQTKLAIWLLTLVESETQFRVHSLLNGWRLHWILWIPFFNYHLLPLKGKMELYKGIADYMNKEYGQKAILRYHNVRNPDKGDMTNEEFNWWWYCTRYGKIEDYFEKYPVKNAD